MSSQKNIPERQSVSQSANDAAGAGVDDARPTPAKNMPNEDEGATQVKADAENTEAVIDPTSNVEEATPSLDKCVNNTVAAMANVDSSVANNAENNADDVCSKESKTHTNNNANPKEDGAKLKETSESASRLTDTAPPAPKEITGGDVKVEDVSKPANEVAKEAPTPKRTAEVVVNGEGGDVPKPVEATAQVVANAEGGHVPKPAEENMSELARSSTGEINRAKPLERAGVDAKQEEIPELSRGSANQEPTTKLPEKAPSEAKPEGTPEHTNGLAAKAMNLTGNATDEAKLGPTVKMSEPTNGQDDREPTTNNVGDAKKVDSSSRPYTRSRTRSLSSAVSSLSGGESIAGDALADSVFDNGKTPLHNNRRSSQGPVRKRHKKGRALFRSNELEPCSQEVMNANEVSKEETLPPLDNDAMSSSVTSARNARARSNTIDSFRAAMGSIPSNNDLDLPTESIILPEMNKGPETKYGDDNASFSDAKKVEDMIGSNIHVSSSSNSLLSPTRPRSGTIDFLKSSNNPLLSPRGRDRSDTIDFLTSAVKHEEDVTSLSNAEKEEDIIGSNNGTNIPSNTPMSSPRPRSDTIDFLKSSNNPLLSPRGRKRSDTIDFLTSAVGENEDSTSVSDANKLKVTIGSNNDTIEEYDNPVPTPRSRSDTIDFLTSHVQFQVDHGGDSVNVDEVHPTPVNGMKDISSKVPAATNSSTVRIIEEGGNIRPKSSLGNATSKGIAFGKTPRKTNRSRAASHSTESISSHQGPLRKRYRTRSLSFALSEQQESMSKRASANAREKNKQGKESANHVADVVASHSDVNEHNIPTEPDDSTSTSGRRRSDTLDVVFGTERRARSDTLDFLTAAVAGDMGHDLDAAMAAAADDGASFAMHHISAPSGASAKYNALRPSNKRPRSDTLDSTASSINSAKLDFLVSVAAEQGVLITSPVPAPQDTIDGGAQKQRERSESLATGSENSSTGHSIPKRRPRSNTLEIYSDMASGQRTRSDTVDYLIGAHIEDMGNINDVVILPDGDDNTANDNVMDHLKALCDEPKIDGTKTARILRRKNRSSSDGTDGLASAKPKSEEDSQIAKKKTIRKNSEATRKTSFSQDSFMNSLTRNRLESWGGMSDLSMGGMGCSSAIAATHTALKDTGILDDVLAAAADLDGINDDISEGASSLERMKQVRTAGGGPNSLSGLPASTKKNRPRMDSLASLSLASLSDTSISIAAPKVEAKPVAKKQSPTKPTDTASVSTPSIVVDYDAIASAVHAANAATDSLDLAAILGTPTPKNGTDNMKSKEKSVSDLTKQKGKGVKEIQNPNLPTKPKPEFATPLQSSHLSQSALRPLPPGRNVPPSQVKAPPKPSLVPSMNAAPGSKIGLNKGKSPTPFPVTSINIPLVPIPKSTKTKEEMDAIRERARKAAGYVPPGKGGKTPAKKPPPPRPLTTPSSVGSKFNPHLNPPYRPGGVPSHVPIKKRGMLPHPPGTPMMMPDHIRSNGAQTPLSYMKPPPLPTPPSTYTKASTLQSQQKWEDMFSCLVKFIEETREKSTKHMDDEKKAAWIWDGNVPTSYKTPCGKALGRWINNQRSAKAKGTLKDDREVRLVSTGLKWSVLTTNSWRQMLRELEIYVHEQTKDGRTWDGNVPTNYKIKSTTPPLSGGGADDEEKNLGRWVNRQRSLFQAGKLKKDRQRDLERIGLKWSVLSTTSWSTMYESLCEYVKEKQKQSPHGWDGNVPANFKTRSNPPLSLGRWVNRQRSAHTKGRLKEEFVKKLEAIGLKWVIHARIGRPNDDDDDDDFASPEFIQSNNLVQNNPSAQQGASISNIALPPLGHAIVDNP